MRRLFLCLAALADGALGQSASPREAFLKLIDRPRVPLAPAVKLVDQAGPLERYHFSYAAEAGQRVPGLLIRTRASSPDRLPVVIALHGTGGSKNSVASLLTELAGKGFLAVAIDGRYHGERIKAGSGSVEYVQAILQTYRKGIEHPFLYDTVWDLARLIDWLETRSDVDASRIGVIGFSKGGMEAYLAAAVDSRIRVVVPCIGVQGFRWALDHDAWQSRVGTFQAAIDGAAKDAGVTQVNAGFVKEFYDRVAPGIYSEFDGPRMLPLIAPRPLLVINGDSDARTPLPGLMECVNVAKKAYGAAGAVDKFEFLLQEGTGHIVNPEALRRAVNWFVQWLSTSPQSTTPRLADQ